MSEKRCLTPEEAVDEYFDMLIKSRFIEMFGDLRTNTKHWKMNKLGDLGVFKTGGTPSSKHPEYYEGTIPFVSTPALGPDYINEDVAKYKITRDAIESCATTLIPAGSLIIGTRINVGKSSINAVDLCTNQDIASMMNISVGYDVLFLKHCLDQYTLYLDSMKKGATIKGITIELLKSMDIPEPPLEKQHVYADFVKQAEKLRGICKRIFQSFDNLVKSRFIEMFGTMDNPKYGFIQIGELVSGRITKVAKTFGSEEVIQYIDIASIDKSSKVIAETTEYTVKDAPSRAQQCVCRGDILLSNVRPNLKTIATVDSDEDNLVCSSGFTVLRCKKCLPEYLMAAIASDVFTENLMRNATGSSYPAVTTKDVMSQSIQRGPDNLQREFADFVKQVNKSKFEVVKSLQKLTESIKTPE